MRSKASLNLMELLIMILVFALTAALCLQCFVLANRISKRQEAKDVSVLLVQNAVETLKQTSGNFEQAMSILGGYMDGNRWIIPYDDDLQQLPDSTHMTFRMQVTPRETGNPLLGSADVRFFYGNDIIFEITTGNY